MTEPRDPAGPDLEAAAAPDAAALDAGRLSAALVRPGLPWSGVRTVPTTGSTNADLARAAREGAPDGSVLVAAEQTAGRGRLARSWSSPPGTSLSISLLLRPAVRTGVAVLPLVAGLGTAVGLGTLGVDARLKWPNDVLVDGLKVCGILAELVGGDDVAVVVGVGVNVSQTRAQLPVPWATSLRLAGAEVTRADAAVAVLAGIGETVQAWRVGGWPAVSAGYLARCDTIGREVRVELTGTDHVTGTAVGLGADGRLEVRVDGQVRSYAAGDVHHLRPAGA